MKIKTVASLVLVAASLWLVLSACSSSKSVKKSDDSVAPKQESTKILEPVAYKDMTNDEQDKVKKLLDQLQDVPFDFDSYAIPTEGLEIIKQNVSILNQTLEKRGKYLKITVEGHADERGTNEYNLALGERRAKAVKDYLLVVGFREESIRLLSYGEERPKIEESTPEAWAANRRAHFTVE
ncbi:MAG: hypothetical protein A2293_07545 [Elusimicrobia bacterium RIFOXYB2_FULL_49_7]|nr:MAG: hypothetical protein A2293_07545 [Elusimicrobia bacterium RIFOXYB2_FULL_49_7]